MSTIRSEYAPPPANAVSVRAFAERLGLSEKRVTEYCRKGRIFGARKHPLTGKWWIYPPAKLLPNQVRW